MSYIDKHLLPNEEVIYETNLHWVVFSLPIAFTLIMLLFLIYNVGFELVNYGGLVITAWFWLNAYIKYLTAEFGVTNMRVLMKFGLFQVRALDTLLQRIGSIQVTQSLLGRIFGYGAVTIIGTSGTQDTFFLIANPTTFRQKIEEQIQIAISTSR